MDKKLFKKIFLFTYIDISKIHKWIWIQSKRKYTLFKRILIFLNAIIFLVYFISAYYALLSILFIITGVLNISFTLLLTVLISVYITSLTLILQRKGFFKRKQLVKFNFSLINENKDSDEIRDTILNLEEELRKYNKRKSKIIVIFNAYIYHFVSTLDIKKNIKLIKNFFRDCSKILDIKDESLFLKEMVIMNHKIKSHEEYKYMQDYLTGVTGIPNESNLFSYLNKLDNYFYKNRLINRIFLSLDITFEKMGKHLNVVILILIILLTLFYSEKIKIILDIISKFNLI
ncbi:hypothetical protein HYY70_00760 [Candidatus Woesearchaeota archaeon]|nr:hypothetical protein [Candidatus Woesearchaeota archaeon]